MLSYELVSIFGETYKSLKLLNKDHLINVYEYLDYAKFDCSKHNIKAPYWLSIKPQPEKSVKEICESGLNFYDYNGLEYSIN